VFRCDTGMIYILDKCQVHCALEAAKDNTVIYHTDQSGVSGTIIYSFEAVFTFAYGLLLRFVTYLPARLVA